MGFEKIVVPSEKELIIEQLERKIISGELPVGSKLPTERELSEQLCVSKSVIHFALKELEQLKFLHCVPRHGTYINDWMRGGNFETLSYVLRLQGANVEPVLTDSLIHLRNTIEADAMELCSHTCTAADFAELQAAVDALAASPQSAGSEAHARLILRFHSLILSKCGNLIYPIMMNAFMEFSILIWIRCVEHWTKDTVVKYEQSQLDMIRSGRGAEAGGQIKQMYSDFIAANGRK